MQNPHQKFHGKMQKPKLTELEKFIESNQDLISEAAHKVTSKIQDETQKCANIHKENEFVNCMKNVDQKVGGFQNKFKFRIAYWQLQTQQCFQENPKDLDTCKKQGRANIRQYLDSFVKQL
ncbi:hypothetical protein TTHERM_00035490 (macronuclear) [Tetrahymena thermophila SB210]|uniref:Uncharacterized protein n=1 Tax=Tetrahymena thermophila (strain SB210) TaxID=312017 RepID=Q22MH1_TETTS|nr:hypothetical protein TTHERM_00035490 [Tetrahymena thermophila SB210]EAR86635.2 hypothetical protein TTHERM_00035490 [Tetrahymena thermophila SB210]|eukprot:XP_977049.2 hypothetical protein TTHERM_00035490 [Tetrahymena thermophila SB210]